MDLLSQAYTLQQANFPNLRRLFIEARTDDEERAVSRKAVRTFRLQHVPCCCANVHQFYNAVLFMGSVAVFSLIAQKLNAGK